MATTKTPRQKVKKLVTKTWRKKAGIEQQENGENTNRNLHKHMATTLDINKTTTYCELP